MPVHVVLVEPKYEGNIGSVARAMKNFGAKDLRLVRPCPLGDEARRRAMHGADVLEGARTYETFPAAVGDLDLVVGTTGIDTTSEKKFLRLPLTPRELAARTADAGGEVGLVFGREDFGLRTEELRACDVLVTIPANPEYPILNLACAAAILLYETRALEEPAQRVREASALEKEKLHDAFADLMEVTNYPEYKRERTAVMFRRLLGRATPTKWEFHALMGVLARAAKTVRRERTRADTARSRRR